ncbi:MAG: YceI family protein [Sediminibacterium sp.]|nr:YceI family protein [Sediminibacterium sp.]MBX9778975.1 YceI family protein [Chitinophagaceae bacterium]
MKKLLFALAGTALVAGLYSFTSVNSTKDVVSYTVNAEKSRVDWVGSKKNDYHTGYFVVKSGSLQVDGGKLKGGEFVIDLANLKVTDPGGGDRLTGHLKTADFFDVAKFGEATYKITNVNYTSENNAVISGVLNLKGASVPVTFNASVRGADDKGFFGEAFFSLDRTLFGINYGIGNVAKEVQIAVHLFATK